MKITADTVTDEQIRELGLNASAARDWAVADDAATALGYAALRGRKPGKAQRNRARLRCVEALNARSEVKP